MGGVFIGYRREDAQGEALHLFDDLKKYFGINRVFMDVTGIDPGKDFRRAIESAVSTCDVLIVMIGKKWLDSANETGERRLDDPKGFVRIEVTTALRRDVSVIPVLVQGAGIPRPEQLPAELEPLAWRTAFELRHNRWSVDVAELVTALKKVTKFQRWWQTVPAMLTVVGVVIAALTRLLVHQNLQHRVETKPLNPVQPPKEVTISRLSNISGIWVGGTRRYTVTQEGNSITWDGIGKYGNADWHHTGKENCRR
jgi:hypothetical protein